MSYNGCTLIREEAPFGLGGVFVEYFVVGFERPCDGNKCIIEARVSLPAGKDGIRDDYVYGESIMLFGKPLVPSWGNTLIQGFRTAPMSIKADTFEEGFQAARNEVELELITFSKIVKDRAAKLPKMY